MIREKIGLMISKFLYERKTAIRKNDDFYSQFVNEGDVVFDVGANVGSRTQAFSNLGAKVISIEPQDLFFQYLSKKFKDQDNVLIQKLAIGECSKQIEIKISSMFPMVSTVSGNAWIEKHIAPSKLNIKYDKSEMVSMVTIDSLIEEFGMPAFCKIDIEGYELNALLGLTKKIPLLSFEFFANDCVTTTQCIQRLGKLGFKSYNWSKSENQQLEQSTWLNEDSMTELLEEIKHQKFSGDIYAK